MLKWCIVLFCIATTEAATVTSTLTSTRTRTQTDSRTRTHTPTLSPTPTPSASPTATHTPTRTPTATNSRTVTITGSLTPTPTATPTTTSTGSRTRTHTVTRTRTVTESTSLTNTLTPTVRKKPPCPAYPTQTTCTNKTEQNLQGACSLLNRQQGCCASGTTVATPCLISPIPYPNQCPQSCLVKYWTFWCSFSCLNSSTVCSADVQSLFNDCNSCGATPGPNATAWAATGGLTVANSSCLAFLSNIPSSSAVPTFTNASFTVTGTNVTVGGQPLLVTVTLLVTSDSAVFNGALNISYPGADGTLIATVPLDQFQLIDKGQNLYQGTGSFWFNWLDPSGAYRITNALATNAYGTMNAQGTLATQTLTVLNFASYGGTNPVIMCTSENLGSTSWQPAANSVMGLVVGCAGTPLSVLSLILSSNLTAGMVYLNSKMFTIRNGNLIASDFTLPAPSTIRLESNANLWLTTPTTPIAQNLVVQGDSPGLVVTINKELDIAGATVQNQVVTNIVSPAVVNIKPASTASSLVATGAFTAGSGTTINVDGANSTLVLLSANAMCGTSNISLPVARIQPSTTTGGSILQCSGQTVIQSNCYVSLPIYISLASPATSNVLTLCQPAVQQAVPYIRVTSDSILDIPQCCVNANLVVNCCNCVNGVATTVGTLDLAAGSIVRMHEVSTAATAFGILWVTNNLTVQNGAVLQINLASTIQDAAQQIPLIRFSNFVCNSTVPLSFSLLPAQSRTFSQKIDSSCPGTNPSDAALSLVLAAVSTTGGSETTKFPFTSSTDYVLTLNQDCSKFGASNFINAVTTSPITGIGAVSADQITVTNIACGSVVVRFRCLASSSQQDADKLCSQIVTDATSTNTPLGSSLQGTSGSTYTPSSSGSSTALYALFALAAIPVLCCAAIILLYRHRVREADNQYMQDTATFSNVAASPQPLGQPQYYAQPQFYPAEPVVPVVAVDPYMGNMYKQY